MKLTFITPENPTLAALSADGGPSMRLIDILAPLTTDDERAAVCEAVTALVTESMKAFADAAAKAKGELEAERTAGVKVTEGFTAAIAELRKQHGEQMAELQARFDSVMDQSKQLAGIAGQNHANRKALRADYDAKVSALDADLRSKNDQLDAQLDTVIATANMTFEERVAAALEAQAAEALKTAEAARARVPKA